MSYTSKDIKNIVAEILENKKDKGGVKSLYFVGCGGSLGALYPAKTFMEKECSNIKSALINSNEFVHSTPKDFGENSIICLSCHKGNTPETIAAAKLGKEKGAAVIILTWLEESEIVEFGDYVQPNAALASGDLRAAQGVTHRLERLYRARPEQEWGLNRLRERQGDAYDPQTLLALAETKLLADLDQQARREIEAAARTVAAYRDRYGVTGLAPLGARAETETQKLDAARARSALDKVRQLGADESRHAEAGLQPVRRDQPGPGRSI